MSNKSTISQSILKISAAVMLMGMSSVSMADQADFNNQHVNNTAYKYYGPFAVHEGSIFKAVMTPDISDPDSDPEMMVQWNTSPTFNSYTCRPSTEYVPEVCELSVPAGANSAYVAVRGYGFFADYDLSVTYQPNRFDMFGGSINNTEYVVRSYSVTPGAAFEVVTTADNDFESDIIQYVQFNHVPWAGDFACRNFIEYDNTATCKLTAPAGATQAFVKIKGLGFGAAHSTTVKF